MKVQFTKPNITEAEISQAMETIQTGCILAGRKTKLLAKNIASYCGAPYAICAGSLSDGLGKVLRMLGVGPGDEVILSAYMHLAAAHAVWQTGARPVLVDTAPDAYTVSPEQLLSVVTFRTKAIILSDIGGVMCDYDQARCALHSKRHLYRPQSEAQAAINRVAIIGEASHSFGSRHEMYWSGQSADFTCFSFHSSGSLFAGHGASIVWRDIPGFPNQKWIDPAFEDHPDDDYENTLTELSASILLAQLSRADIIHKRQREIIRLYDELLGDSVQPLSHHGKHFKSSGAIYMVRVPGMIESERDALRQALSSAGIETKVHYKPLPMHPRFQKMGYSLQAFQNAFCQYENEMTLPLYASMPDNAISFVADSVKRAIKHGSLDARGRSKSLARSM